MGQLYPDSTWRGRYFRDMERREREFKRERRERLRERATQEIMRRVEGGNPPPQRYTELDRLREENISLRNRVQELQTSGLKQQDTEVVQSFAKALGKALHDFFRGVIIYNQEAELDYTGVSIRFRLLELD